jgi:hypothetical protein
MPPVIRRPKGETNTSDGANAAHEPSAQRAPSAGATTAEPRNPAPGTEAGTIAGDPNSLDRRSFLCRAGSGAAAAVAVAVAGLPTPVAAAASPPAFAPTVEAVTAGTSRRLRRGLAHRRQAALRYRYEMARLAASRNRPLALLTNNGEEDEFSTRICNYSKALPHNSLGEVDAAAYAALLAAVASGEPADFDAIPLAGARKLTSPQAGLAFDLEGPDSHSLALRPAPRFDSAENSSEMAELCWMALCRDVNFTDYAADPLIADATDDLSSLSDFRGPKLGGLVTPATIFRGSTAGDRIGPYVSQFLLKDIRYGSLTVSQRQRTVLPNVNYLTSYDEWHTVQNGGATGLADAFDATPRHLRTIRDLGQYVHVDALYQAYLNACLILLALGAPVDPGLPPVTSPNQIGFAEFGGPHVLSLVTEVATRALKAVWCQKWLVHRRLRPEEFGGRVHNHLTGAALYPMIDDEILNSAAMSRVFSIYETYLLPQAYPDGCPTHPAYGSGHATVAGACVTVLKSFFDESFVLPDPVVPDADGTALVPYVGADLTVGNELNKLAANIALARSGAGIHWRTDYSESLKLGEAVALGILAEQKHAHNQDFSCTLTKFDGTPVTI